MTGDRKAVVVAIDGPAASGKGTLSRELAARFNLAHLDTGSLYRAVAAKVLAAGQDPKDPIAAEAAARGLQSSDLQRSDLRTPETAQASSIVAGQAKVRAALLDYQRRFAARAPGGVVGAVLDGRDIGTVVCPDADVKLFVTASKETRARRRHKELVERGDKATYDEVLEAMIARDRRDSERATAPLEQADDAHLLDTSELGIEQAVAQAAAIIQRQAFSEG
ncbi:MAG: (d)CMP kinase [Pseudomonadota bacterium]